MKVGKKLKRNMQGVVRKVDKFNPPLFLSSLNKSNLYLKSYANLVKWQIVKP